MDLVNSTVKKKGANSSIRTLSKEIEAYVQTTTVLVQDIWTDSADQKAWRQRQENASMSKAPSPLYYINIEFCD